MESFTDLPNDMIELIIGYMDLETKCRLSLTSKQFQNKFDEEIDQTAQSIGISVSNGPFKIADNFIDPPSLFRLFFGKVVCFARKNASERFTNRSNSDPVRIAFVKEP